MFARWAGSKSRDPISVGHSPALPDGRFSPNTTCGVRTPYSAERAVNVSTPDADTKLSPFSVAAIAFSASSGVRPVRSVAGPIDCVEPPAIDVGPVQPIHDSTRAYRAPDDSPELADRQLLYRLVICAALATNGNSIAHAMSPTIPAW